MIDPDTRLTLIGPMPPPINGQSVVMRHMAAELEQHFSRLRIADTREGGFGRLLDPVVKLSRSVASWWAVFGADSVYIAVKAGHGMWLTTAAAGFARLSRAKVFLHHHSYLYVRERKRRMVALTRAAGPEACHIVLSDSMANQLTHVMPEIRHPFVVGNAGLIDKSLLHLPLKSDGTEVVFGHVSDLSVEKGIAEVVDLAVDLLRAGKRFRLIIGGPTTDDESRRQIARAAGELGDRFEYRGVISGKAKHDFFEEITHFVFPSRYAHEAVPLVLYEALAAGVVCVATRQGAIADQLNGSPSFLAAKAESFVDDTLPVLLGETVSYSTSAKCREAYVRALRQAEDQLGDLIRLMAGPASRS